MTSKAVGAFLTETDQASSLDVIKRSHALSGKVDQLDDFYRDWADSYDADVSNQHYQGPTFLTALAVDAAATMKAAPSELTVLDAGCGTGLVGVELAKAGFKYVDGIDLSHPMVAKARDTGSYRRLIGGVDLNQPIDGLEPFSYDLLVCCGVFTLGHVRTTALDHLLTTVRRGGVLVISTRHSYLTDSEFATRVDELVVEGQIGLLHVHDDAPYIDEEGASYWVLRMEW